MVPRLEREGGNVTDPHTIENILNDACFKDFALINVLR